MTEILTNMPKFLYVGLVEFGGDVNSMHKYGLVKDKKKAIKYIQKQPLTYGTRSMCAIEKGMLLEEVDTIYFLSDGAPLWGQFQGWAGMRKHIQLLNRYRHIAFFSVCFDPSESNRRAMGTISKENYGKSENNNL